MRPLPVTGIWTCTRELFQTLPLHAMSFCIEKNIFRVLFYMDFLFKSVVIARTQNEWIALKSFNQAIQLHPQSSAITNLFINQEVNSKFFY